MEEDTLIKIAREINTKLGLIPKIITKGVSCKNLQGQLKQFQYWHGMNNILEPETIDFLKELGGRSHSSHRARE